MPPGRGPIVSHSIGAMILFWLIFLSDVYVIDFIFVLYLGYLLCFKFP